MTTPTQDWAKYYEAHKTLFCNPTVPWRVKLLVRYVELYRSDSNGWNLSLRKISAELGVTKKVIQKAIIEGIKLGYLESTTNTARKRRKLKLSVLLRAPVSYIPENLDSVVSQSGPPRSTESVPRRGPVNNKENNKLNNNTGRNFFRNENDESYLTGAFDGEGYKKLRAKIEQLRAGRATK